MTQAIECDPLVPLIRLSEVAAVNKNTIRLKGKFDWINYTDISSVVPHFVGEPTRLDVKDAPGRARRQLFNGDVVISTVRPNRRSFFKFHNQWSNAVCSTGFAVVSPIDTRDADYLYAVLTSAPATDYYESICEGGAYPAFNGKLLLDMQIPWPDVDVRKKIGQLSSDIGRKIGLNLEISLTLQALAQAIFKSWFIQFEPVHAKARGEHPASMDAETAALFPESFEDSEIGIIPLGWKVETVENLLRRIKYRSEFKTGKDLPNGDLPVIQQGEPMLCCYSATDAPAQASYDKPIFVFGDHTCRTRIMLENFIPLPNTILLASRVGSTIWAYYAVKDLQKFESYRRHWMELAVRKVALPASTAQKKFDEIAKQLHIKITNLDLENKVLADIRDTLLPRLVSGQIAIPAELFGE